MREEVLYVIFLYLHKAYNALGKYIYLGIQEGYGVVPQSCHILRMYWDCLQMVAQSGGCYGAALQVFQGLTQGGAMYPTIFNVVVDTIF